MRESVLSSTPELLYLLSGDPAEFAEAVSNLRAPDIAEAVSQLSPDAAARVVAALPFDLATEVLDAPELEQRPAIVQQLDQQSATHLLEAMSADQRAEVFRELPESDRARLIKTLDPPTRDGLKLLLQYSPETAGGIMTTEFVSVPANWTVDQALRHIREVGRAKETIYAVYVVDPDSGRLVHVVSLRELMLADRASKVISVGGPRQVVTVTPSTDREDVGRIISRYNLLAVPVVHESGRVLGIVTVDDVIDAIVAEQTEDVQKFGGMEALDEPYTEIAFSRMIRKRAGWLAALFLGEMLTATAMAGFQKELEQAVVLALFIPLIISSGGNSGSQATSLIIRALALREVTVKDWWRVAFRELPSGVVLGVILGSIGMLRILAWQLFGWYDYGSHYLLVAFTVGVALVGVVTFGSLAGSMLPFVMRRLGFDPASASAPFVATLVDVTGIVIFFTVAAIMLRGTLL